MEWHTNGYADNTYGGSFVSRRRGRTFKYPQFIQKLPRCQSLFCGCRQKLFPFITPTGHVQDVAPIGSMEGRLTMRIPMELFRRNSCSGESQSGACV